MQSDIVNNSNEKTWLVTHPLCPEDAVAVAAMRSVVAPMKGKLEGTAGRAPFDAIMNQVPTAEGVTFESEIVGGISGWWARPDRARQEAAIIHLHGGWFNWGTAKAFRNFVGHVASSAGAAAFIPDYRLAPENPFPAAVQDVEACYRGLARAGYNRIAVTGDSAGGNLALVLLTIASARASGDIVAPIGAVAFSPVTDLALTGASFDTRAEADPLFTKFQVAGLVRSYLAETDPKNPLASPLYGDLTGLPSVQIHVGDDEVLLDDSRRYADRAVAARVDAKLDVWMGMPHGFVTGVGKYSAATKALKAVGEFLADRLGSHPVGLR